ncbi:MAG: hypothetical protein OHK0019_09010 [Saprospiraceae bacterium]
MNAYYETIEKTYSNKGLVYTWQDFENDFGLKNTFSQPRFGLSAHLTYKDWPVFLILEAMSSPSSYTRMSYGAILGLGKDFFNADETRYFTFLGGIKRVKDNGFGANTLVNSVRDDYMRERIATFFNPEEPLGSQKGTLYTLRLGYGMQLGEAKLIRTGVELYGELDMIDKTRRNSRMTNYGVQIYLRFNLWRKEYSFYPNPAGSK